MICNWHWPNIHHLPETDLQIHFQLRTLNENDWSFQFDNELPQSIEPGKIIYIPKGVIHRLIKGTSELSIYIKS